MSRGSGCVQGLRVCGCPPPESEAVGLMERLFQGRLVLRTRCLECESSTERREDFQDVSVPVQEDEHSGPESSSEGNTHRTYTHTHTQDLHTHTHTQYLYLQYLLK